MFVQKEVMCDVLIYSIHVDVPQPDALIAQLLILLTRVATPSQNGFRCCASL